MSKLRFKISMSLDGFVAGPSQSVENPLGIGGRHGRRAKGVTPQVREMLRIVDVSETAEQPVAADVGSRRR